MRLQIACAVCAFLAVAASVQGQVSGRVFDAASGEAMPFVHVVQKGSKAGTATDIDGRFKAASARQGETLIFTFVGYTSLEWVVDVTDNARIELKAKAVQLGEAVVLPGENPAEGIMRKVIANKDLNNPERCCAFTYDSYNKLVFTAMLDAEVANSPERLAALDSSDQEAIKFFEEQHLLLMESVSERRFIPPGHSSEEVKASRFSGLSNPEFVLLGTQLQSFSFYDDEISLLDYRYLSPLHDSAIKRYLFVIEDTTYQAADTVFILSYRPRSGKNIRGMKGLLYINSNGYALENVMAEPAESTANDMGIRIRQHYAFIDNRQWFPVQLNTDLVFKSIQVGSMAMVGIGRSYIKNIQLDAPLRRRDVGEIAMRMDPLATRQTEEYWALQRFDSLDSRELKTYVFMDSLSKAERLDQRYKWLQALSSGRLNMGYVDFDLTRLARFNDYEGFRLGGGLYTSERLMKRVSVGGYGAYGFRDRAWKWGADATWKINPRSATSLKVSLYNDVFERGGQQFPSEGGFTSDRGLYLLFMNRMDRVNALEAQFTTRLPGYFTLTGGWRQGLIQNTGDYRFVTSVAESVALLAEQMDFSEVEVLLRWSYREVIYQTNRGLLPVAAKYPVLAGYVTAGDIHPAVQAERYYRMGVSLDHTVVMPTLGNFTVFAHAGQLIGEAPALRLFNFRSSGEAFTISTPFAFETVPAGSMLADRYAAIHLRHSFRDLLFKMKNFKPHVVLVHSMGIGTLDETRHRDLGVTAPDQGIFESGLELQHLLRSGLTGIGIGGFYRYGSAATGVFKDDVFVKFTVGFAF